LSFENVFVFHSHAFNIALLLAVDFPTAQEAQTKPGAQWEAQMDMKYMPDADVQMVSSPSSCPSERLGFRGEFERTDAPNTPV
jgi:hypothetical protein